MKRYIVAANWKMNKNVPEAVAFTKSLAKNLLNLSRTDIILCPPFTALFNIGEILKKTEIYLGAQNMHFEASGAFTGEISANMLNSVNCQYVILGHSERRHVFGESDELIHKKLIAALNAGLKPILCVGEKLEERESGRTREVLRKQYTAAFTGIDKVAMQNCVIAYEPVWAIGTGVVATSQQASEAHKTVRTLITDQFDTQTAADMIILYGGSVKPANADELIATDDIDGFLVGGASLVEEQFIAIAQSAEKYQVNQEK